MVETSQLKGKDCQNGLKENKSQLHEISYTVNISGKTNFRKHFGSFLKTNLIYNLILYTHAILLAIPLLSIHPREMEAYIHTKT